MERALQTSEHTRNRPDLDIGVIYTNEPQWMPRLLSTLRDSGPGLDMRLLMVDNCSKDGVQQWVEHFPGATILNNSHRLTYAANLNRVLEASRAPYVLLLNTDLYLDPSEPCLTKMVEFMDRHPQCGISGCGVYHEDGSYAYPARRFQTIPVVLSRRLGLERFMPGTLDYYLYRDHPIEETWECDWLSGCFLMIRREAFEDVGYFDVGFVKYFEDVDICLRMSRAGWSVMYNGQTYYYHLEARGSTNLLSADAWHHARSYVRWLQKWGFSPNREPAVAASAGPARRAA